MKDKLSGSLGQQRETVESSFDRERAHASADQIRSSLEELAVVAGVLVLGVLNNTTILLGVPYEGQFIVKGAVFLAVVGLDSLVKRR